MSRVIQETPLLEIPLVALVDTLVERVEHTLRGPTFDEVLPMDEVLSLVEGSNNGFLK